MCVVFTWVISAGEACIYRRSFFILFFEELVTLYDILIGVGRESQELNTSKPIWMVENQITLVSKGIAYSVWGKKLYTPQKEKVSTSILFLVVRLFYQSWLERRPSLHTLLMTLLEKLPTMLFGGDEMMLPFGANSHNALCSNAFFPWFFSLGTHLMFSYTMTQASFVR